MPKPRDHLHGGTHVGGWTAKEIHQAILTTFDLSSRAYGLNRLRYDLRKLKGHALLQRDGSRYAYRLTTKGVEVALLFLFSDPTITVDYSEKPLFWRCSGPRLQGKVPSAPIATLPNRRAR